MIFIKILLILNSSYVVYFCQYLVNSLQFVYMYLFSLLVVKFVFLFYYCHSPKSQKGFTHAK